MGHSSTVGGPTIGWPWLLGGPAREGSHQNSLDRGIQGPPGLKKQSPCPAPSCGVTGSASCLRVLLCHLSEAFPNHMEGNCLDSPASCTMLGFSLQHVLLRLSIIHLLFILLSITFHFPITSNRHGVWVHSCVPQVC